MTGLDNNSERNPPEDSDTGSEHPAPPQLGVSPSKITQWLLARQFGRQQATYTDYMAILDIFDGLWWLKHAVDPTGELISVQQFHAYAQEAGVGPRLADEIIQRRMFEKRADIVEKHKVLLAEAEARGDAAHFRYPTITQMIKPYRPRPSPKEKPNTPEPEIRAENLALSDELKLVKDRLEVAEREAAEAAALRRARDALQDELADQAAKIAELEERLLAALVLHDATPEPPATNDGDESEQDSDQPEQEPEEDQPDGSEPEPPRTADEAVELIYSRNQIETCETVADALRSVPMRHWEPDEFEWLAEELARCARWDGDHNDMAHTFAAFERAPILFGTAEGVLIYENGLKVLTWPEAMERIAPELEQAERKREFDHRQQEMRRIMRTKLPAKRKLKAMKLLLDELTALQPPRPEAEPAIAFIRAMTQDDDRFADCATFDDYFRKAAEMEPRTMDQPADDARFAPLVSRRAGQYALTESEISEIEGAHPGFGPWSNAGRPTSKVDRMQARVIRALFLAAMGDSFIPDVLITRPPRFWAKCENKCANDILLDDPARPDDESA